VSEFVRSGGPEVGISAAMDAFTAVVTTGIYCQPSCSGRPRAENTCTFALAAAAEAAGYRACLRCRPYRYPQVLDWSASELVCRAVRLILDGALDRGGEHDLAARLGVSARHLRRLFTAQLGVTPDGLARSARVHFARRLLDDTDLSVTEVALAAGFGSLRQFNRACREVFHESPRLLRARRRKADRLVADGGLRLRLPYLGPLDWDAMLAFLSAHAVPGVEHVSGDTYRRTVVVDGYPGVLELFPGGPDHLLLCAHLPRWDELVHLVQRARRIANLDFDLDAAGSVLGRDAVVGPLIRARPGVRPPGAWDGFETGVLALVAQGRPLARAAALVARLVERLGARVPGLEQIGLTSAFPAARDVAEADLGELGLPRECAVAVRAFACAVADDAIRVDRSVGLEDLIASFAAVPGLRPGTAEYIALRLGEPDASPGGDLPPRRQPWQALASTHLWLAAHREAVEERLRGAA
jgi:AraC family transcriptional regulator, regulatory protein of adaptative response / DNA-3-methyladenine glycosylase II